MVGKRPDLLTEEQKTFIIELLAQFEPVKAVVTAFKQRFPQFEGDLTPQRVEIYDPSKYAGRNLSAAHRKLFAEIRAEHIAAKDRAWISHRSVRLARLARFADAAELAGNLVLAAAFIEQAAKDDGGVFTNTRNQKLSGELTVKEAPEVPPSERLKSRLAAMNVKRPETATPKPKAIAKSAPKRPAAKSARKSRK
jgi:hypothetical protein